MNRAVPRAAQSAQRVVIPESFLLRATEVIE